MPTVEVRDYNVEFLDSATSASLNYPSTLVDGDRLIFINVVNNPSFANSFGNFFNVRDRGWTYLLNKSDATNETVNVFTKIYRASTGESTGTLYYPEGDSYSSMSAILAIKNGIFLDNYSSLSSAGGTSLTFQDIDTPSSSTFNLYVCGFGFTSTGASGSAELTQLFITSSGATQADPGLYVGYDYTSNTGSSGADKSFSASQSSNKTGLVISFASQPPAEQSSVGAVPARSTKVYPFTKVKKPEPPTVSAVFSFENQITTGSEGSPATQFIETPSNKSPGDVLLYLGSPQGTTYSFIDAWHQNIRWETIFQNYMINNGFASGEIAMRYLPTNNPNGYVVTEGAGSTNTRVHNMLLLKNAGYYVTQSSKLAAPFANWFDSDLVIEEDSIVFTFAEYESINFTVSTPAGATLLFENNISQRGAACWYEEVSAGTYLSKSFGSNGSANYATVSNIVFTKTTFFQTSVNAVNNKFKISYPSSR